ncbi:MAG TPA: antibiotic biosynthesis monooxygenase [Mycobacterium sp.]
MATISEGADVHTLIVMFTVEPSQQDSLVEHLRGIVAEHSRFDGFVSCSIHRSEDGTRVAEYIQWRSAAHLEAVLNTPEGQAQLAESSRIADGHDAKAHVYQVVSVTQAGQFAWPLRRLFAWPRLRARGQSAARHLGHVRPRVNRAVR